MEYDMVLGEGLRRGPSCGGGWASSGSESARKIVIVRNLHTAWTPTLHIPSSPSPLYRLHEHTFIRYDVMGG